MQFFSDNIDQLDLALDHLSICDRNYDRFALMLIDNVVELTLHKFAQDKFYQNESSGKYGKQKLDPKHIQKALGQNFDNKVKFAYKCELIDNKICESILNLHIFRNTAYHKGLRHEGILHSIAIFYLICACEVLSNYTPPFWGFCSKDHYSHRAIKYIGKIDIFSHKTAISEAFKRIKVVGESLSWDLTKDLYRDMEATIISVDRALEFIATNSPEKVNRSQIIVDSQAWPFAFTEEGKKFAQEKGCQEECIGPFVEWIKQNYKWPISKDPIPSWKKRLASLTNENSNNKALKKYCDFMIQTDDIRSKIHEAESLLDAHIQEQIDIMRGK